MVCSRRRRCRALLAGDPSIYLHRERAALRPPRRRADSAKRTITSAPVVIASASRRPRRRPYPHFRPRPRAVGTPAVHVPRSRLPRAQCWRTCRRMGVGWHARRQTRCRARQFARRRAPAVVGRNDLLVRSTSTGRRARDGHRLSVWLAVAAVIGKTRLSFAFARPTTPTAPSPCGHADEYALLPLSRLRGAQNRPGGLRRDLRALFGTDATNWPDAADAARNAFRTWRHRCLVGS